MNSSLKSLTALMVLLALAGASAPASAQSWPDRPIRYIVPYAPGGTTDVLARMVAQGLKLGQPVVVDNKAGQGGALGMAELARSQPDGYTIGGGTLGTHVLNVALYRKLPYHPQKDFEPVILLARQPNLLLVHPSLKVNTVSELVALLKANPGKYSFGSAGNGSSQHIGGEMFKVATGTDIQHVPYKGSSALMNDLLAGHIHIAIDNMATAWPMAQSGRLKGLAVTSLKRAPAAPDVPTLNESGLAGYEMTPWHAVFAPAGTPRAIVARLQKDIAAVLAEPVNRARLAELGMEAAGGSSADLAGLLDKEIPRMRVVVQRSGAAVD